MLRILTHNRPDSLQYYSSETIQVSAKKGLHTLVHTLFSYTPNILLIDIHTFHLKQVSFCSTTGRGWSIFKGLFKTLPLRYKRLSAAEHVANVLSSCSGLLYDLRIPRTQDNVCYLAVWRFSCQSRCQASVLLTSMVCILFSCRYKPNGRVS